MLTGGIKKTYLFEIMVLFCRLFCWIMNGQWKGNKGNILVIKITNSDLIVVYLFGKLGIQIFNGKYDKGKIKIAGDSAGEIIYDKKKDSIYYIDEEYKRKMARGVY